MLQKDRNLYKNLYKNKVLGFTLIELIVVILILAILAAIALPRFTKLQRDARIAKLNAAKGSVAATASLLHAAILAKNGAADTIACAGGSAFSNNNGNGSGEVCTENGIIKLLNAYPAVTVIASAPGILAAAGLTTTFDPTQAELNADGYDYSVIADVATFMVIGGINDSKCSFTYEQAKPNSAPKISAIDTTGC